jgi:hypothetical protein
MRVIFLDVDGVLNGYNFWNQLGYKITSKTKSKKLKKWYRDLVEPFGIHILKFKRLVKIVRKTDAKIVISSSWRFTLFSDEKAKDNHEDDLKFWYLIKKYKLEVIGRTPRSHDGRRDKEILTWLSKHEDEVDGFVILDDERFDLECFVDKELVQTSSVKEGQMIKGSWRESTGLKNKHVKQAIKILNS